MQIDPKTLPQSTVQMDLSEAKWAAELLILQSGSLGCSPSQLMSLLRFESRSVHRFLLSSLPVDPDSADEVLRAPQPTRRRFLGVEENRNAALPVAALEILELVGRGGAEGVNRQTVIEQIGLPSQAQSRFSLMLIQSGYLYRSHELEKKRRNVTSQNAQRETLRLSRFAPDLQIRPAKMQSRIENQRGSNSILEVEEEVVESLIQKIREAPEKTLPEDEVRQIYQAMENAATREWFAVKQAIFSTGKICWCHWANQENPKADYSQCFRIVDEDSESDSVPDLFPIPTVLDMQWAPELPILTQVFRSIQDAGTNGILVTQLIELFKFPSKFMHRMLKVLEQRKAPLVAVMDRNAKQQVRRYFTKQFAPDQLQNNEEAIEDSESIPHHLASRLNRNDNVQFIRRLRWAKEILSKEKIILDRNFNAILRWREHTFGYVVDRKTLKRFLDYLEENNLVRILLMKTQNGESQREDTFRVLLDPALDYKDPRNIELAKRATLAECVYTFGSSGTPQWKSIIALHSSISYSSLLKGFIPCKGVRVAVFHLHLTRLVTESPDHFPIIPYIQLCEFMPLSTYVLLCGVTEDFPSYVLLDEDNLKKPLYSLQTSIRDALLQFLLEDGSRPAIFVQDYLTLLAEIGFIRVWTQSSPSSRDWLIEMVPYRYLGDKKIVSNSMENILEFWLETCNSVQNSSSSGIDKQDLYSRTGLRIPDCLLIKRAWKMRFNLSISEQNLISELLSRRVLDRVSARKFKNFLEKAELPPFMVAHFISFKSFGFYRRIEAIFCTSMPKRASKSKAGASSQEIRNMESKVSLRNRKYGSLRHWEHLFDLSKPISEPSSEIPALELPNTDDFKLPDDTMSIFDSSFDSLAIFRSRRRLKNNRFAERITRSGDDDRTSNSIQDSKADEILSSYSNINNAMDDKIAFWRKPSRKDLRQRYLLRQVVRSISNSSRLRHLASQEGFSLANFPLLSMVYNVLRMVILHPGNTYKAEFAFNLLHRFHERDIIMGYLILLRAKLVLKSLKRKEDSRGLHFVRRLLDGLEQSRFPFGLGKDFSNAKEVLFSFSNENPVELEDEDGATLAAILNFKENHDLGLSVILNSLDNFNIDSFHPEADLEMEQVDVIVDAPIELDKIICESLQSPSSNFDSQEDSVFPVPPSSDFSKQILERIRVDGNLGRSFNDLRADLGSDSLSLYSELHHMEAFDQIKRVRNFNENRFVIADDDNLWFAHSSSTKEESFLVEPWRLFDGSMNLNIIQKARNSLFENIWLNPGISDDEIFAKFAIFSPQEIRDLLFTLELDDKILSKRRVTQSYGSVFLSSSENRKKYQKIYFVTSTEL